VHTALARHLEAAIERDLAPSVLLACLPFARRREADLALARDRRMLGADVATLVPLAGHWRGTRSTASVLYSTRGGTPLPVDTRDCESNPNFLVVGGSGKGKSYFVHHLVTQIWRQPDVRVYLLSIKPDYARLGRLFGRALTIDLDSAPCLNPFCGPPTAENEAFWLAVLTNMLSDEVDRRVTREERATLSHAASTAAARHWDADRGVAVGETTLDDVIAVLRETRLGQALAAQLQPYQSGPYRRLFNGPRGLSVDERFVFFDLARLAEHACRGVAYLCLFRFVTDVMRTRALVGVPKYLGLDEVWALLKDPYSAGIVEWLFRAIRSFGGVGFAVSQSLEDFDSPVGRAILQCTATKFVLGQEEAALGRLRQYAHLNEREFDLVRSLALVKRKYSEVFVKMEGAPGTVARVIADPLTYAIGTTDAGDEAIHQRLLAECGGDAWAAVERFASEYPYGQAREEAL